MFRRTVLNRVFVRILFGVLVVLRCSSIVIAAQLVVSEGHEKPLTPMSGFMMNDVKQPVAGARLTPFASMSLSRADEELSRANDASVVTSSDGSFATVAASDRNATFLVEALGYVPILVSADQFGENTPKTVVLKKGASLTIRWSSDANASFGSVSLIPVDAELPQGLTRERAIRIWTQSVGNQQRWPSLPAGTYQIVLRAGDALTNGQTPVDLGEVVLAAGDDESVRITLPRSQTREESVDRAVSIRIKALDLEMLADIALTEWHDGAPTTLPVTTKNDGGDVLLTTVASCKAGNTVAVESAKAIGAGVFDGFCTEPLHVTLRNRAIVSARVSSPRGAVVPRTGTLRFTKCGADGEAIEIPFAMTGDHLRLGVPAECGALSVRVAGFAPIHPMTRELRAGDVHDLGLLSLRKGAAAVLRVRSARNAEPLESVRITAVRASNRSAIRGKLEIESASLGSAVTDSAGWARLTGLPDDRVVFSLHASGRKYPQWSEEYELPAGDETVIDDLTLEPAANVLVTLSVPARLREDVVLSEVELLADENTQWPTREPMRAELTPAGAVLEDVPPGRYLLHATGRIKNGFALKVAETTVSVVAGVDQQIPLTLTDTLYSGRVTRAGLAVKGTINLKPADRRSSHRPAVSRLDGDGNFHVLLDGPGNYSVFVQTPNHDGIALGHYVEFTDPDEAVEVELPTGRMAGRVFDSAGNPVTGVMVTARQQIAEPAAEVAGLNTDDGRFTLEGVTAGTWEVFAESKSERSEAVIVAVGSSDVDGISLVVDPTYPVAINVVGAGGEPLDNVFVQTEFPRNGAPPKLYGGMTHNSGQVKFRLLRSEQSIPTNLVFVTDDARLSCAIRTLTGDQRVEIPSYTGDARLVLPPRFSKQGSRNWLISPAGCGVPFVVKPRVEQNGDESLLFRGLTPGQWTFVQAQSPDETALVLSGRGSSLVPIRKFVVERGKTRLVTLTAQH